MISENTAIWLASLSLATFVVSLLTLPWLVSKIPCDYFNHDKRTAVALQEQHPLVRLTLLIVKNVLGWVLLAGGMMMLFLPGQGLLTMAMGLVLMDYPGKYRLERRIVSVPVLFRGLNWLRAKRGAPPLTLSDPD